MENNKIQNLEDRFSSIIKYAMLIAITVFSLKAYTQGVVGGSGVSATGQYSSAIGYQTQALGVASFAGGWQAIAQGDGSFSFGDLSYSKMDYAISLGFGTKAYRPYSISIGYNAISGTSQSPYYGDYAIAIGSESQAIGNYSMALGSFVKASGTNGIVIGKGVSASQLLNSTNTNSLAVGFNSTIPTLFVGSSSGANTTGNVGIGTSTPSQKLEVQGNVFINDENSGLILKSQDGTQWKLRINNDGQLEVVQAENMEDLPQTETIDIFPNPANESIQLSLAEKNFPVHVKVYDMEGTMIYMQAFYSNDIKINISAFPQGNYVLQVVNHNQEITQTGKFVKM